MTLEQYLQKSGLKPGKAATQLGLSRVFFWNLRMRKAVPSYPVAVRICRWSNDEIGIYDLEPIEEASS